MGDHDMAYSGIVFERIDGHILAVAGLLHATMGHLIDEHEMGVEPSAAILKASGATHRKADIPGPDG